MFDVEVGDTIAFDDERIYGIGYVIATNEVVRFRGGRGVTVFVQHVISNDSGTPTEYYLRPGVAYDVKYEHICDIPGWFYEYLEE